jgi:small subunit ribosomal protein S17
MKQQIGRVVKVSDPSSASVEVVRRWTHPIYKKTITRRKKYLTHCKIAVKAGDRVVIAEGKPVSKRKRWVLLKKL